MKPKQLIFLLVLFFTILIIFFILKPNTKEPFLTKMHQAYRPYIRKARLYGTNKYRSLKDRATLFLRKWGIL
jgi:hypothetical protein